MAAALKVAAPKESFVDHGRYPPRPGNRVHAWVDGNPAFRQIARRVEAATHSVHVTVAWIHRDFVWPDGRDSFFDLLDRAAARGVDVRVLFWRSEPTLDIDHSHCFSGTAADRAFLERRRTTFGIRWDHAGAAVCHHQKSWIIDAGHDHAAAFVGGMNINPDSLCDPGHANGGMHDVFVQIEGPATADVYENFVDRWNCVRDRSTDGTWGAGGSRSLEAAPVPPPQGKSWVQIQRTMQRYGERTIFDQYLRAIEAAEHYVYIENQAVEEPTIIATLRRALERGVAVVAVVPAGPIGAGEAVDTPSAALRALGEHPRFCMVGLSQAPSGHGPSTYVHAKIMLIDDRFATIGSCNLRWQSLQRHSELNASVADRDFVKDLRCRLFEEHIGLQTERMTAAGAIEVFVQTARQPAQRGTQRGITLL